MAALRPLLGEDFCVAGVPHKIVPVENLAKTDVAGEGRRIRLGEAFGTRLSGKSSILGGLVLIAIGLEIFITGTVLK